MSIDEKKFMGHMYIAKRPCGKISAMAWDDKGYEESTAKSVASWIKRGDAVERIARHEGDPELTPICGSNESCKCKNAPSNKSHP